MRSGKHWIKKWIIFALILTFLGVGVKALDRADSHHERGGMHRGFEKHHELIPGMAVFGTIVGAGALYLVFKRRKRLRGVLAPNATAYIPSASDFLDEWEKNHTNTKESK